MKRQIISVNIFVVYLTTIACIQSQTFTNVASSSGVENVVSIVDSFGSGTSVADFDNDGDLDFFVGTDFGLTNQLYRNTGNGQFQEVAVSLGINSTYRNRASLWFDYNGDERLDLLLLGDCLGLDSSCINRMAVFLYQQTSTGQFIEITNSGLNFGDRYDIPNVSDALVGGVAAGDINNDGWLDLIVTVWGREFIGAKATLFLNNANGTFTDITANTPVAELSASRFQPVFHDFNRDGFLDIYINVDFGNNEFWLNNGDNTFTDIAGSIGADNSFNEMGMTVGDYDNDGDIDVYSTNISRLDDGTLRHNILLQNNWESNNTLMFSEVSNNPGIAVGASGWDWGTTFFDANNDGFLDLATTNGWGEGWGIDQSKLWQNIDGSFFTDISSISGFNDSLDGATLLAFDMDRDGDLDLLQSMKGYGSNINPVRLLENSLNTSSNLNNYLVVKPRMNGTNHFSIGAVVKVLYNNGQTAMRLITAGTSFYGQEPAEAFFGLADNTTVDEVIIEWPDNTTTIVDNVAANQVITITNSVLSLEEVEESPIKIYPNPTEDFIFVQSNSSINTVEIYNILGQSMIKKVINTKQGKIDISTLASGSYFIKLKIENNKAVKTFRIIKS